MPAGVTPDLLLAPVGRRRAGSSDCAGEDLLHVAMAIANPIQSSLVQCWQAGTKPPHRTQSNRHFGERGESILGCLQVGTRKWSRSGGFGGSRAALSVLPQTPRPRSQGSDVASILSPQYGVHCSICCLLYSTRLDSNGEEKTVL
ncbi:hypothetical protein EX30DRAFT_189878 [Ascodesmis nigricans]|uniref:Uncharacterized protein n=1 Tax=Ascodesmis nigricans TaxID=341454 RepID=A0A4S2N0S9_9PEZI|nr:hypothetical protein EX30DRAFT_189878 [Ascodesmis nigricans]